MNSISTGKSSENDDELHRKHTTDKAQLIFLGGELSSILECKCQSCVMLRSKEAHKSLYEKALDTSTRITYAEMPRELKHLSTPDVGLGEYPPSMKQKTINMGWD